MEGIPFLGFMGESMATFSPLDFFVHSLDTFNSFSVRKILEQKFCPVDFEELR